MEYLESILGFLYTQGILDEEKLHEFRGIVQGTEQQNNPASQKFTEFNLTHSKSKTFEDPCEKGDFIFNGKNDIVRLPTLEINKEETPDKTPFFVQFSSEKKENSTFAKLHQQRQSEIQEKDFEEFNKQLGVDQNSVMNLDPPSMKEVHDSGANKSWEVDLNEDNYCERFILVLSQVFQNLTPQDMVQMSERVVQRWQMDEEQAYNNKMGKLISAYEKIHLHNNMIQMTKAFYTLKEHRKEVQREEPNAGKLVGCYLDMKEEFNITNKYSYDSSMISTGNMTKSGVENLSNQSNLYGSCLGSRKLMFSPNQMEDEAHNQNMFQRQSCAEESPKRAIHLKIDKYTPKKTVYLNQNMHIEKAQRRSSREQKIYSERLARPRKIYEKKEFTSKEEEELDNCTFIPDISASQACEPSSSVNPNCTSPESTYERLYYKGCQSRDQRKHYYAQMRWEKEDHGCTFHPQTNSPQSTSLTSNRRSRSKKNGKSVYARLYTQKIKTPLSSKPSNQDRIQIIPSSNSLNPDLPAEYAEHSVRKSAQRKAEIQVIKTQDKELKFVPERVTKGKDSLYGLDKEPYYEKFNRLYNDHAEKHKKRRRAKKERDEIITKQACRTKRGGSGHSKGSRRHDSVTKVQYPKEIQKKTQKLLEKVNREEGVTFHPKINKKSQALAASKSSTHVSHRHLSKNTQSLKKFTELASKYSKSPNKTGRNVNKSGLSTSGYKNHQNLPEFKLPTSSSQQNDRYHPEDFTYSKLTEQMITEEDDPGEIRLAPEKYRK
ncbi:unnamed protein product [Moneuplotes crassus]|uniref:Uncharacterized protein n=1 Tax=Euplotes crassus TaxID=5936 RepID=A0AAD1XRA6_EUPCR|nr:unnamed protein product [Moneuplotes crassus]